MGRAPNADSLVGNYVNRSSWISKTIILVATQIHLVVPPRNGQCLCQLSRTRTKLTNIDDAPPLPHQRDSASWLERTDENKTVFPSFHQDVQHPVNAVIEIERRPPQHDFARRRHACYSGAQSNGKLHPPIALYGFRLRLLPRRTNSNSARTQRDHGHSPADRAEKNLSPAFRPAPSRLPAGSLFRFVIKRKRDFA